MKQLVAQRKTILKHQNGVSLIELLVALVIGLLVSLVVFNVLNAFEGRKRTTNSVNDIDQAGTFAMYQLDKVLRSSGSGFTGGVNARANAIVKTASYSFGCQLNVTRNGAQLLPMLANFAAPFTTIQKTLTLAPIVIVDNAATSGDVIISMSGSGGISETLTNLTLAPATDQLSVLSAASLSANDVVLAIQADNSSNPLVGSPCVMDQIDAAFAPVFDSGAVPLLGDFHNPNALTTFNDQSVLVNLGRTPQFNMYGVGANNTLFRYDLLQPNAAATSDEPNPSEFVEGVFRMEGLYWVSDAANALTGKWEPPTGDFSSANLLAGNATANERLRRITMVRLALIMRTSLREKTAVSPTELKVFESTGASTTQTITGLDQNFRYRVIEANVPIRNNIAGLN